MIAMILTTFLLYKLSVVHIIHKKNPFITNSVLTGTHLFSYWCTGYIEYKVEKSKERRCQCNHAMTTAAVACSTQRQNNFDASRGDPEKSVCA